jgi:hypothetical protein
MSGEQIGGVSKKWSGFLKEMFTDADTFGINFPVDLDVKIKAVLMGALFLIVSFEIIINLIMLFLLIILL